MPGYYFNVSVSHFRIPIAIVRCVFARFVCRVLKPSQLANLGFAIPFHCRKSAVYSCICFFRCLRNQAAWPSLSPFEPQIIPTRAKTLQSNHRHRSCPPTNKSNFQSLTPNVMSACQRVVARAWAVQASLFWLYRSPRQLSESSSDREDKAAPPSSRLVLVYSCFFKHTDTCSALPELLKSVALNTNSSKASIV